MEPKEIQLEIAILAKQNGYDRLHLEYFTHSQLNHESWFLELVLLQKWLREKKQIDALPTFSEFSRTYGYKLYFIESGQTVMYNHRFKKFKTYEEALETALKDCLNAGEINENQ